MVGLLVLFFSLAIGFSFLCSLWEAVLLSITPSYAEIRYREGTAVGRLLRSFKDEIDRPLAAILTLNTIAHTVGAIGVGSQAAVIWADASPWITSALIPIGMTLAILVLSELIPKTLGATYWQPLVPFTVASLRLALLVLAPLVWLSSLVTGLLKGKDERSVLSRSDFVAMAEIGAETGVFQRSESEMIANLMRFHRVRAADIMTPRTVVRAAPEEISLREYHEGHATRIFSRIPTYHEGSKDRVTGYVLKDDVLEALVAGRSDDPLSSIRREILVVPDAFPVDDLFYLFLEKREHIAAVVDEFGGMAGIVTMEDVIETLLGLEIVDESDTAEDMQALARRSWERRARALGLLGADAKADATPERGDA